MVIVRESPRAKLSPDKSAAVWPPKSPFHALLSSPSGRKKWQDHQSRDDERSPSPSPIRRPMSSSKALQALAGSESGEEEDEEALELGLREIEVKKKLARLKRARREGDGKEEGGRASSRAGARSSSPRKVLKSAVSEPRLRRVEAVEVALSPAKDRIVLPQEQVSPARRRLGINAPVRAQDVSLKRARDGTQLPPQPRRRQTEQKVEDKQMSFSAKLAASKAEADERHERHERIDKSRSNGFSSKTSTFQEATHMIERTRRDDRQRPRSAHGSSRPQPGQPDAPLSRTTSTRSSRSNHLRPTRANGLFQQTHNDHNSTNSHPTDSDSDPPTTPSEDKDTPSYDPFSELHLSKRHLPHPDIARALSDTTLYTLPRLLKEVHAPTYEPPDVEGDYVLFAILASKSSPYDAKAAHRTTDEGKPQQDASEQGKKFMVLHLCDLKWEVDLFLFGSGFDRFWKLTPGTLLAILNPAVMPPKTNQHNGRFSLKLGSCEDRIMEIGVARDLGFCSAVKKDGRECGQWIDKRRTEVCEFHINLLVERQRKGRMEVNTMFRDAKGGVRDQARSRAGVDKASGAGRKVHGEYGQLYSVPSGLGKTAASLLDAEDMDVLHDMTQAEASRKRIAAAQKERDLRQKLGREGRGVGAEYLRSGDVESEQTNTVQTNAAKGLFEKPKAATLGLLDNDARSAHLSPAKDRKRHFGMGATSSAGTEAMGWGGARKAGLLQPSANRLGSPEKGQTRLDLCVGVRPSLVRERSREGSLSPKKRARFLLREKGIREPGRESLGVAVMGEGDRVEEDELEIV